MADRDSLGSTAAFCLPPAGSSPGLLCVKNFHELICLQWPGLPSLVASTGGLKPLQITQETQDRM